MPTTGPGGPYEIVTEHIDLSHAYANDAFDASTAFLERLASFTASVGAIEPTAFFDSITTPNASFNSPTLPPAPVLNPVTITIPGFTPLSINTSFPGIGTLPTFTASDPVLNLPSTPAPLAVAAPGTSPAINTSFVYPSAPAASTLIAPEVPLFIDLDLPTPVVVNIQDFTATLPDVASIGVAPQNTFNWSEVMYTDQLLDAASTELYDRIVNGGTGLNPTIERALWDRARNREDKLSVRGSQQLIKEQSARGFSRPPGAMTAGLDLLSQETQNKIADLSREIALKQADLEQENIKFALTSAIQLEGQLLGYSDSLQKRAFEAEQTTVTLAIEVYKARVQQFGIELDTYKAAASTYESTIRAELAKVEIYKTELEAQGLINDVNDSNVRLYIARLDGIKTSVETYRAQVDAVNSRVQAEALKLDIYKGEVEAFGLQVGAKRDEFAIYSEQVKAELSKVSVFEAQARAFTSRVQGYAVGVDAGSKQIDAEVEAAKAHTSAYLASVDGLIKQAQANQLQVESAVDIYKSQATLFTAEVGAESSRVDAQSKLYDLEVREATVKAEIALKNADIAIANADNISKLHLSAIESGAQVSSQLAASSLSAMNIGASISGSSSDVHSYQEK